MTTITSRASVFSAVSGSWDSTADAVDAGSGTFASWGTGWADSAAANLETFNFSSIPAGATINSITCKVKHYCSGFVTSVQIRPYVGATAKDSPHDLTLSASSTNSQTVTLSGLTLADLKDSGFKIRFETAISSNGAEYLDYIEVTVDYTAPVSRTASDDISGLTDFATTPQIVRRVDTTKGAPANTTSFQITMPSYAAGDRGTLIVTGKYHTTTVPTIDQSWTLVGSGTGGTGANGNDTGQTFWAVYQKDLSGSETAPTVTKGATAPQSWNWVCHVHRLPPNRRWRDTIASSAGYVASASDTATGSPLTGTTGVMSLQPTAGDSLIGVGVIPTDSATALGTTTMTSTGLSGGSVNAASTQVRVNALGQDCGMVWSTWDGFTGTASAGVALSYTITGSTNHSGSLVAVALRATTLPKISTFTDDFTTADNAKWSSWSSADNQALRGRAALTGNYTGNLNYASSYDLTASSITVELAPVPTGDVGVLQLTDGAGRGFIIFATGGGNLNCNYRDPSDVAVASVSYNPVNHRWLRISESGGTVTFSASADRSSWTTLGTTTFAGLDTTGLGVVLAASATGTVYFDNVNLAPSAKIETLVDDFATKDTGKWAYAGTTDAVGGQLVLGTDWNGVTSQDTYDLTNSAIYLEMVRRPASTAAGPGDAIAGVALTRPGSNDGLYAYWYETLLNPRVQVDTVGNYPYDATDPYDDWYPARWARIRESAGTIYWDYSLDGVNWDAAGSYEVPFDITGLKVTVYSGVSATVVQQALVDNVNTPVGVIAASALTDNFATGSVPDPVKWFPVNSAAVLSSGQLHIPNSSATANYREVYSAQRLNFTGSSVSVEVAQISTSGGGGGQTWFRLVDDYWNHQWCYMQVNQSTGTLHGHGSDDVAVFNITYDPVAHRFWRMRESAGTAYFDTSPDGQTWTQRGSGPHGFSNPGSLSLVLGTYDGGGGSGSDAIFDNVNTLGIVSRTGSDDMSGASTSDAVTSNTIFSRTGSDDVSGLSDAATRTTTAPRTAGDDISGLADAATRATTSPRTPSDDISGLADAATRSLTLAWGTSDDISGLTDAVASPVTAIRAPADDVSGLADSVDRAQVLGRALDDDASGLTDEAEGHRLYPVDGADDVSGISDTATQNSVQARSASEVVIPADVAAGQSSMARSADDTIADPTDDAAGLLTRCREVEETIPDPVDDLASSVLLLLRSGVDAAPADDAPVTLRTHVRSAIDTAAADDEGVRTISLLRSAEDDETGLTDTAAREGAFVRDSGDAVPASDDGAQEQATLFRSGAEDVTGVDDATARYVNLHRVIPDAAGIIESTRANRGLHTTVGDALPSPGERLRRTVLGRRSTEDEVEVDDAASAHSVRQRSGDDTSTVTDGPAARAIMLSRLGAEGLSILDTAARRLWMPRIAIGSAVVIADTAVQQRALARSGDDVVPAPEDVLVALALFAGARLAPRIRVTSMSRAKVSRVSGYSVSEVEIEFDQPVTAWTVRVGASSPVDGQTVAQWYSAAGETVTSATVEVHADMLRPGINVVTLYARSALGVWSR